MRVMRYRAQSTLRAHTHAHTHTGSASKSPTDVSARTRAASICEVFEYLCRTALEHGARALLERKHKLARKQANIVFMSAQVT